MIHVGQLSLLPSAYNRAASSLLSVSRVDVSSRLHGVSGNGPGSFRSHFRGGAVSSLQSNRWARIVPTGWAVIWHYRMGNGRDVVRQA